ncbi:MAG: cupin domain-containing protein [Novosphingobium sp.]
MTTGQGAGPESGRSHPSVSADSGSGSDISRSRHRVAADGDARWQQIEARVAALVAARPRLTITADSAVWLRIGPGVQKRQLYVDADAGWESYFLKLDPGAEMPPHAHSSVEECLVLSGEMEVDGDIVREGDLHIAFAGHDHGALTTQGGVLLYIRCPLEPLADYDLGDPIAP